MKSQLVKLKHIAPGPIIIIGALLSALATFIASLPLIWPLIVAAIYSRVHVLPQEIILLVGAILIALIVGAIIAAAIMGIINFSLHRSGGVAFEFEIGEEPEPARAPLPQFAPPPPDPPDPRRRRAQAEQALDAQSKILRR